MLAMLILYKWTILAGCLASPALALLGTQLATRDRAMQTMCVGQGAMVGVLLGLGFLGRQEHEESTLIPLASALAMSALCFFLTDSLVRGRAASKNTFFAFAFSFLLAAGHLVSSLFPALENHLAQIYFGDLATLTVGDSMITVAFSAAVLALLIIFRRQISRDSFEAAVFGERSLDLGVYSKSYLFGVLSLLMLCMSVQFVGFLFTISMLFIPTSLMSLLRLKGLSWHFVLCSVLASISTLIGFTVSLEFTRLPTVPTIVATLCLLAAVVLGAEKLWLAALGWALRLTRRQLTPASA